MGAFTTHYEQSKRNASVKIVMCELLNDVPSVVSFLRVDSFGYMDSRTIAPTTSRRSAL
jgi:hypothetical protein